MESFPLPARFGNSTVRILLIHVSEEECAAWREFGSCDRIEAECIQADVPGSSLLPYMILARLRFDIAHSWCSCRLHNCHSKILRQIATNPACKTERAAR